MPMCPGDEKFFDLLALGYIGFFQQLILNIQFLIRSLKYADSVYAEIRYK